jgi:histone H3/H4
MSNLIRSDELQHILDVAETELQNIAPTPFSENAFVILKERISEFIVELMVESIKVTRRHRSEQVAPADVEHAAQYLVASSTRKTFRHMGTVGGILLGAVGSNLLGMATTHQFTLTSIIVTFALTLIGAFLVAIHIAKD